MEACACTILEGQNFWAITKQNLGNSATCYVSKFVLKADTKDAINLKYKI